jgi:hypothetical protein
MSITSDHNKDHEHTNKGYSITLNPEGPDGPRSPVDPGFPYTKIGIMLNNGI